MIAGAYYSATGSLPWQVWPAALPYGLLCTAVLMGKHLDKLPWDQKAAVGTLPVIGGLPLLARALSALRLPRPEKPPREFPVWPMWFAALAFTQTRRADALMVAGLAVAAIFGLGPAWLSP